MKIPLLRVADEINIANKVPLLQIGKANSIDLELVALECLHFELIH